VNPGPCKGPQGPKALDGELVAMSREKRDFVRRKRTWREKVSGVYRQRHPGNQARDNTWRRNGISEKGIWEKVPG